MKRSEMINIMIKADKDQSSCNSLYRMMSNILEAMENNGIRPPPVEVFDETTGQFHGRKEYKWEKE